MQDNTARIQPTIVIKSDFDRFEEWRRAFADHGIRALRWDERQQHLGSISYALVWHPEPGSLAALPGLEVIFSVGAGIDHLMGDQLVPAGIPVVRMVEDSLTAGMIEYVVCYTLMFHRNLPAYAGDQKLKRWKPRMQRHASECTVGILGLGVLGGAVADLLVQLGFQVRGWSRSEKNRQGVTSYFGENQLDQFLSKTNILVCLLPNTPATAGIVNGSRLGKLPKGACFVSAGRGASVVDADLIAALESGHLQAAALDVFNQEPLPESSPYWDMPNVLITPHVASMTLPASSAQHVAESIGRHQRGEPLTHLADLGRGY